ncbi:MAG: acyltransferase [Gemmatimonadetes bacterium]|nr:acyltransferase [Gemmatimonadota bacterium]
MAMAFLPLRQVDMTEPARRLYDRWLGELAEELADEGTDRNELCRRVLTDLYYPQYRDADPAELPLATQVALLQMDPRNITLEPEYYADIDPERYYRVKPLLWLWEMFDKSPLGENVHLGVKFRRVLAQHIFRRCGRNFKAFHFVKFSYGYNMEVGDDVVVHRHVLLDDRGGIVLGNRVSIADYANIYSHTHALADGRDVDCPVTVLGDGVRVTYHATVLAGVHLAPDSMVGALAVATKDVDSGEVALGIPAVPKLRKPAPEARPKHPVTVDPLADAPA